MRRRLAPTAGLALLLAGGALLVRVAAMTLWGDDPGSWSWLVTAAACVLAGVALVLVALPKIAVPRAGTADQPEPELPRG